VARSRAALSGMSGPATRCLACRIAAGASFGFPPALEKGKRPLGAPSRLSSLSLMAWRALAPRESPSSDLLPALREWLEDWCD
jgi:hypothetical protein